ncbi:MAG: enolase C-terminal domain-like protein [Haloarculaceae archaeon]
MSPTITELETVAFEYELADVAYDGNGFNLVYDAGSTLTREGSVLRVHTSDGRVGETTGHVTRATAEYLLGTDPLDRERHWSEIRRAHRQSSTGDIGAVDVALWDLAGKYADLPVSDLLGSYRERLPCYASTPHGDENGGLDSPEAYADFAETCRDMGYPAFKIHGWGGSDESRDLEREIDTVHAVGERVGDGMDLMLDPACEYETFLDALKVGEACDEQSFTWYEDPYRDNGTSRHSHRQLRERLETPLLMTEHVQGLEPHTDAVADEATDFVRGDLYHGITGLMKVARVAEGFGLDVELHGPGPAMRQCMAAIRNTNYYEMGLVHPGWDHRLAPDLYEDYADGLRVVDDDGTVPVPDDPGLGVSIDWDYVEVRETDRRAFAR